MGKIPVFVSCPTELNPQQEAYNRRIDEMMERFGLERKALGRTDYPLEYPLKEVYALAKHCAGGLILGFEQVYVEHGMRKRGLKNDAVSGLCIPTPWNHLEAGILYSLGLPLLIIKEDGITGGVFDKGSSGFFVHSFELLDAEANTRQVFTKWVSKVNENYYG